MTNLDTLLQKLEKLDDARTPGKIMPFENGAWGSKGFGVSLGQETKEWLVTDVEAMNGYNAVFLAVAADSNKVLREVIKIQREALEKLAVPLLENQIRDRDTLQTYAQFVVPPMARQALEAIEKLIGETR